MPFPISFATMAETEAALDVSFPARFKLYMSRSNGGDVQVGGETWFLFPFRDTSNRERIRRTANDIGHETKEMLEADVGFPREGIAIADNGAGDCLFLRRDGDRLRDEVWRFQLDGGESAIVLDDVADLWEGDDND